MDEFIHSFEEGTIPKSEWTHAAHLRVACWYLLHYSREDAIERLRSGIRHLNECIGGRNTETSGYHETLTVFWVGVVGRFLAEYPGTPEEATEAVLAEYGTRSGLFRDYYSFNVPASREARARWVPPDLSEL